MSRYTNSPRPRTTSEQRMHREHVAGLTLLAVCLLGICGMFYGAYQFDKAHGISVSESLRSAGL